MGARSPRLCMDLGRLLGSVHHHTIVVNPSSNNKGSHQCANNCFSSLLSIPLFYRKHQRRREGRPAKRRSCSRKQFRSKRCRLPRFFHPPVTPVARVGEIWSLFPFHTTNPTLGKHTISDSTDLPRPTRYPCGCKCKLEVEFCIFTV